MTNLKIRDQAEKLNCSRYSYPGYLSHIYTSNYGINPLVSACDQLLTLISLLEDGPFPDDRENFFLDLVQEIKAFEHQARLANYDSTTIASASYALCVAIDNAVISSSHGKSSGWKSKQLLNHFHTKNSGTQGFHKIIEHFLKNTSPAKSNDLGELLYLCLTLGFREKRTSTRNKISTMRTNLYQAARHRSNGDLNDIVSTRDDEQAKKESSPPQHDRGIKKILSSIVIILVALNGLCYVINGRRIDSYLRNKYNFEISNYIQSIEKQSMAAS